MDGLPVRDTDSDVVAQKVALCDDDGEMLGVPDKLRVPEPVMDAQPDALALRDTEVEAQSVMDAEGDAVSVDDRHALTDALSVTLSGALALEHPDALTEALALTEREGRGESEAEPQ